jgi:GTP-binding protein EngB required for normal cell division
LNRTSIAVLLEQTSRFLEAEGSVLLPEEQRQSYLGRVKEILEKARHPGEVLYVGIMGGTGVGKSTLIDALAREEISAISEKRPFTDRAVVYRHRDTPRGLENLIGLLRDVDAVHGIEAIKDFILLDLPDFDSKDENNRLNAMRIAPQLDGIVWVASPEKYGDAVFYEFVKQNRADQTNYTFVLNKADELIDGASADPYSDLKKVLGDFTFRLKHEAGVREPRIFSLSSVGEFKAERENEFLHNEFARFRTFLMSERDAKEIASVKTANLQSETQRVLAELRKSVRPEEKRSFLKSIRDMDLDALIKDAPPEKPKPGLTADLARSVTPVLINADASIRPVKSALKLLKFRRSRDTEQLSRQIANGFEAAAQIVAQDKRSRLEQIAAMMDSELLLAFPAGAGASELPTPDQLISEAKRTAYDLFAQALEKANLSLGGALAFGRRLWQKSVLSVPIILFAAKLVGMESIRGWIDHPSLANSLKIALGFLTALFGSEGLIGLIVVIIFETLLIWRLAAGRLRKVERLATTIADSAFNYLEASFDSVFQRIRGTRATAMKRIEESLEKLEALTGNESV